MVNNDPRDPIVLGQRYSLFELVTVDGYDFPALAQVLVNFKYQEGFSLINYGTGVVEYSLNGTHIDGELRPGTPSESQQFDHRSLRKLWLRLKSGASAEVAVHAW